MKKYAMISAILTLLMLTGCSTATPFSPAVIPTEAVPLAVAPELSTAPQPAAPTTPEVPTQKRLTTAEVKAIALKHAGLADDQIQFLRIKLDLEDGIAQYEVEFISDGWEYEYDIHAETGRILSFDKDR